MNITQKWHAFIEGNMEAYQKPWKESVAAFARTMDMTKVDYDEFNDEEYGDIGVFYFDFQYNDKVIHARYTEPFDNAEGFWGFPSERADGKKTFDEWLSEKLDATHDEIEPLLEALRSFYEYV